MKKVIASSSTKHSVYAEMADALDKIEEASEIIDKMIEGMYNYHGNTPKELDEWAVKVRHCMTIGDQMRGDYRYVDYFI